MDCGKFGQMLDNYENLSELEMSELTAHASQCEKCRSELEFYKSIIHLTATLPALDPPADLLECVNKRIDSMPKSKQMLDRFANNFRANTAWYATVAACAAVGVIVGLNGKMIVDRLADDDTDGIIRTTVTVSDETGKTTDEYDIVESTEAENVLDNAATQAPAEAPEALKRAVSKTEPKATAAPKATAKPSAVTAQVTPTQTAVKTTVQAAEAATETATSAPARYTIARGDYHIPTETAAPTQAPEIDPLEITEEKYQIAMGVYEIPEEKKKELAKNILVVNESDIRHVFDLILATGIKGTTTGYVGTESAVQELLAKLEAEGLYYNYLECSETNGEVAFKLYAN